jgi:sugar-specific transcriptional regulator TrmB
MLSSFNTFMLKSSMKINDFIKQKRISPLEEKIYHTLSNNNNLSVKDLATLLDRPVESINRSVNLLIHKGFTQVTGKYPKHIKAIPLELVFSQSLPTLSDLISSEIKNNFPLTFLPSRTIYHQTGQNLFLEANKEILMISSGTGDLNAEYYKIINNKIHKGVTYKILALSNDKNYKNLKENWKKNGIEVRYKKGKDFNVIIYDRNVVQIGIRIAESSKEKWGLVIRNESLGQFMGEFFDDMWSKAKPL